MSVVEAFKKIEALCNAPHWTPARRWEIERIAREARLEAVALLKELEEDPLYKDTGGRAGRLR